MSIYIYARKTVFFLTAVITLACTSFVISPPTAFGADLISIVSKAGIKDFSYYQSRLKVHGFDPGPIDGLPGKQTTTAIKSFQRSRRLVVDGILGPVTKRALDATPPASQLISSSAYSTKIDWSNVYINDDLKYYQRLLEELGFDPGPIDGILGSKTTAAIVSFQKSQKLTSDGILGPITKRVLAEAHDSKDAPAAISISNAALPTGRIDDQHRSKPCEFKPQHEVKTGLQINRPTKFGCRFRSGQFTIFWGDYSFLSYNDFGSPPIIKSTYTEAQIHQLAEMLNAGYEYYNGIWSMPPPQKSADGTIHVTISVAVNAGGLSRENIIQFRPQYSGGVSVLPDRGLVQHELFHQFQWAITDDAPTKIVLYRSFLESMASYAGNISTIDIEKGTQGTCKLQCVCDRIRGAVNTVQKECAQAQADRRKGGILPRHNPWGPAYRGQLFFFWAERKAAKPSVGQFLVSLLRRFDAVPGTKDVKAFELVLGNEIQSITKQFDDYLTEVKYLHGIEF